MKKFFMAIILVTTILFSASAFADGPTVHHVVLVKLKDGVTPQQVEEMITVGKALLSKIPGVLEVSFGKRAREDRPVHIKDYDLAIYVRWENNETGKYICASYTAPNLCEALLTALGSENNRLLRQLTS